MTLDLVSERGTPLEQQRFSWRELVPKPFSKLDADAFTRVRVVLMGAIEGEAVRSSHANARTGALLRTELARLRRVEEHQRTLVCWLNPPDQSALESIVALEQAAVEVTASVARAEPNGSLAAVYRFAVLDELDHLYRVAALMDRVEARDANTILQSKTDIRPGRPMHVEHRHPDDDLHRPYDRRRSSSTTKLNARIVAALASHARDRYVATGPMLADPLARQLFAELTSLGEQQVTAFESLLDPDESVLERVLLHELCEVYCYYSCLSSEPDPRIRALWQRLLDYELGHLHHVKELMKRLDGRDPAQLIPRELPSPILFESHRQFVRGLLRQECDLRAAQGGFIPAAHEHAGAPSLLYRAAMNSEGSPSDTVAAGYRWAPGTELTARERLSQAMKGASG